MCECPLPTAHLIKCLVGIAIAVSSLSQTDAGTPRILVPHAFTGGATDHTSAVTTAIANAKAVNGTIEFEAGKTYRVSEMRIWRDTGTSDAGTRFIAGIEGNGAVLKWPEGNTPAANKAMLYVYDPQYKGNTGFYIRNLTLDCGNNDIPTDTQFANRADSGVGLVGTGSTGQLEISDKACDFGLWLYGGENFLVENVTCLRAKFPGVRLQCLNNIPLKNVVLRNVMCRYGANNGFDFRNTTPDAIPNEHITFLNCYAHKNQGKGFELQNAANLRFIGCGAEQNKSWNVYADATVGAVDWLGGYTEKGNFDHLNDVAAGFPENKGMKFEDGCGPVRILGGRLMVVSTTVAPVVNRFSSIPSDTRSGDLTPTTFRPTTPLRNP